MTIQKFAMPVPFGNELRFLPVVFEKVEKRLKVYVWNGVRYKEIPKAELFDHIKDHVADYCCFSSEESALNHIENYFGE